MKKQGKKISLFRCLCSVPWANHFFPPFSSSSHMQQSGSAVSGAMMQPRPHCPQKISELDSVVPAVTTRPLQSQTGPPCDLHLAQPEDRTDQPPAVAVRIIHLVGLTSRSKPCTVRCSRLDGELGTLALGTGAQASEQQWHIAMLQCHVGGGQRPASHIAMLQRHVGGGQGPASLPTRS